MACNPNRFTPRSLAMLVAVEELLPGEPVLRLLGVADDRIALTERARVVAEGEQLRKTGVLLQEIDMGDVVEVDDCARVPRLLRIRWTACHWR